MNSRARAQSTARVWLCNQVMDLAYRRSLRHQGDLGLLTGRR
nr:MAG TPA_asm: hypothetical protein [Caudoviricetes sp.]